MTRIAGIARSRLVYALALACLVFLGGLRLLPQLVHDRYLLSSLLSVFCAQGMKPITAKSESSGLTWKRLVSSGGMPSAHAAVVASLATSLGLDFGWTSPLFQVSAVLGGIVIYDAVALRRVVGEHSLILKEMVRERVGRSFLFGEMIGHTVLEASVGVLIGVLCAVLVVRL
ncbi:MAG: divergent PAP2 family protein [Thermacetogeniaceae bacterium]